MKDLKQAEYVCNYILKGGDAAEFLAAFHPSAMSAGFDPEKDLQLIGMANQTTMLKVRGVQGLGAWVCNVGINLERAWGCWEALAARSVTARGASVTISLAFCAAGRDGGDWQAAGEDAAAEVRARGAEPALHDHGHNLRRHTGKPRNQPAGPALVGLLGLRAPQC